MEDDDNEDHSEEQWRCEDCGELSDCDEWDQIGGEDTDDGYDPSWICPKCGGMNFFM